MQKELLRDFLHLYHSFSPRAAALVPLLAIFDNNPANLRQADPAALSVAGLNPRNIARLRARHPRQVDADLEWAEAPGHHLLCYDDPAYPALLSEIPDPPALLYACGKLELLGQPQIAIVGSRHCTPGGAQNAFEFARDLAAAGITISSGLAYGVDAQAHRGALETGDTIAVTGTGPDIDYPAGNRELAQQIRQTGLLITEFPLGLRATRQAFPQRNRIISGLSLATLVVEATERSGSLITARLAAEQGREVFAIPGSIHNPQARGCHRLLREGAGLAQCAADIVSEIALPLNGVICRNLDDPRRSEAELDPAQQKLLQAIGYDPVNCDILVRRSGLTIEEVSSMLAILELYDLIQSAPGGCFVRI